MPSSRAAWLTLPPVCASTSEMWRFSTSSRDDRLARGVRAGRAGRRRRQAEVGGLDDVPLRHHRAPLEDVAELADVAGPVVGEERAHRLRRDLHPLLHLGLEPVEEVLDEERDVLLALPQRGQA